MNRPSIDEAKRGVLKWVVPAIISVGVIWAAAEMWGGTMERIASVEKEQRQAREEIRDQREHFDRRMRRMESSMSGMEQNIDWMRRWMEARQ